jgi:hypothetical protein
MNGQVSIKFNKPMNTRFNASWINQTNAYIYVQPQDKRDQEIGFNSSLLNSNWKVDSN